MDSMEEGVEAYRRLTEYAQLRCDELSGLVAPYIEVTDRYGELVSKLVLVLGRKAPTDPVDEACRDLLADVFDFLYEARRTILASQFSVAFPLLRRAYESTSLLAACEFDRALGERWVQGKQISNSEVRRVLSKHPMGEQLETTNKLYKFLSQGAHPNREMVPGRSLGTLNQFVLGSISQPDLIVFAEHCRQHLSLWFWFCAVITFRHKELTDMLYGEKYCKTADDAKKVAGWFVSETRRLRREQGCT